MTTLCLVVDSKGKCGYLLIHPMQHSSLRIQSMNQEQDGGCTHSIIFIIWLVLIPVKCDPDHRDSIVCGCFFIGTFGWAIRFQYSLN